MFTRSTSHAANANSMHRQVARFRTLTLCGTASYNAN